MESNNVKDMILSDAIEANIEAQRQIEVMKKAVICMSGIIGILLYLLFL